MIGINVKTCSVEELADYLNRIEEAEIALQEKEFRYLLHIKGRGLSNTDLVCNWAAIHGCSTSVAIDALDEGLIVTIYKHS